MKLNIEQILEDLIKADAHYIGIRGSDYASEVGDVLDESYYWDCDQDVSSYHTDNPIPMGGTCATRLTEDVDDWYRAQDKNELKEEIMEQINFWTKNYYYAHVYILASKELSKEYEWADYQEIHMVDPVVVVRMRIEELS